ncbi:MAG: DUF4142 domain-containing protein [Ginsengibacter sp.]
MKKFSTASLILMSAIFFSACNGNSSSSSSMNSDTTSSKMTSTDTSKMSSSADTSKMVMASDEAQNFSKDALLDGMTEVELGKIAMKNGGMQSVKDFGKMMVDDHTMIDNEIQDLGKKYMIDLPTTVNADQQKVIDKLSKETGKDFDKDYMHMMVDGHKKAVATFKKEGDKITESDYKDFIMKTLPTLQKHLDAIEAIDKKM